jgi:hypothetical protein
MGEIGVGLVFWNKISYSPYQGCSGNGFWKTKMSPEVNFNDVNKGLNRKQHTQVRIMQG